MPGTWLWCTKKLRRPVLRRVEGVAVPTVQCAAAAADMARVKPEANSDFCIDRYAFRYLDTTLKIALKIAI